MNNWLQVHGDAVHVLAGARTWIEGAAIQQLATTARLPGMSRVVGMPDLHPGRGYPVGAAFFSVGRFYPALVGNDIGCGMALWQSSLPLRKARVDKLEHRWGSIDGPLADEWADRLARDGWADHRHHRALGTIGGGNHFAELQKVDEVHDAAALERLGVDARCVLLLVHSGSRGLGEAILRAHVDAFGHGGLEEGSSEAASYLAEHDAALGFAAANRTYIAERTLNRLRLEGSPLLDVHHNTLLPATVDGVSGWLHRKGATPSNQGAVVIPGSRGDYSYLVEPLPSPVSLFSLAHGAGRKWVRSECRDRLGGKGASEALRRTALGSRVICDDRSLLFEEAPEAYKPVDSVVGVLEEAGLVRVLARLAPLVTYKTRREGCCP